MVQCQSSWPYTLVMVINGFIESKFSITFDSAKEGSAQQMALPVARGNEEVWKSGFNSAHTMWFATAADANPGFLLVFPYCPGGTNRTNTKDWTADLARVQACLILG